jgi:Zn-dependent protease
MLFYLLENPILIVPVLAAIIIAFTVHEFSHALTAELLGDNTPKVLGRLTLNPLSHIHGLGFLLLIVAGFGWGKPVPFNANNLKNPKWGSAIIALAGPFSNLVLAVLSGAVLWLLSNNIALSPNSLLSVFLVFLVQFNIILMLFNLLPIPPLDGSKLLFALIPDRYAQLRNTLAVQGPIILLFLVIFDSLSPVSIFGTIFNFFLSGVDRLIS